MKKILLPILVLTSSVVLASEAKIDTQKINGFYLGAGIGNFSYNVGEDWDNNNGYGELVQQTDGNTLKIYSGYQFNKVIAIEATYTDYGDTEGYVYTSVYSRTAVKQSPTSFSLAANAGYTFTNGIRPFALLGLSLTKLNSSFDFLDTDKPTAIKLGFGVEYAPVQLKGIQLRVAYESDYYFADAHPEYKGEDEDYSVNVFSLNTLYAGISYKF